MKNLLMTSIDLSIVRNVGVNIVSSSQILMLNICFFYTIFCIVHFLIIRFYTALHIFVYILDILYEGLQCFLFFYIEFKCNYLYLKYRLS